MAIYHFSVQIVSRSQGRSTVAAAAYRSAEQLVDKRLEKTHNFTSKNDVLEKEILLPTGAPNWMKDRELLWNAVEQKENRKDAQLAREINIALPRELNQSQNWELARDFVQREFVDKGMVADVTFHASGNKEEAQPHAHVMLTMRELTEEGFGQKVREWNDKELLKSWREHWSERCNVELARHGFDVAIDHRSLEAQAINLEPQSKIGPKVVHPNMARFIEHQELAERNGERIKANPDIALYAITRQQSTFTYQDVARFINRHSKDAEQFEQVYEKVLASSEIVRLGKDERNVERYTTQTMLTLENGMMDVANKLYGSKEHCLEHINTSSQLSDEQYQSLRHITVGRDLSCVVGYAGTGKSYMLGFAKDAWESKGYNVIGATLSGIAAENLEAGANIKSYTVANRLWHWERGRELLTAKDVLVIDEAGMLGSRQMAAILQEVDRANAKAVLIGDPEQLQAIEAGAAFRAIATEVGYESMTEIRRQLEAWQKEATKDFAENHTKIGLLAYEEHDNIHKFITRAEAVKSMVETWDEVRSQTPEKSQIMLAYTKVEVKELNEYARSLYRNHGELWRDFDIKTSRGNRKFAMGDRVYFLRNENHNLHVKNGTLGTIWELDGTNFTIKLDTPNTKGQDLVHFNIRDYQDIEHGYAATVHKAQGITVDRAYILASKYFDKHTTYVAMSRHREGADLYYAREEFGSFTALSRALGRERAKDVTLDYPQTRNIEAEETKLLQANNFEQNSQYSMVLTEERRQQAEQRLIERQYNNALKQGLSELTKKHGLDFSVELKIEDKGTYIGQVELVGKKYGALKQGEHNAKLLPIEQLESRVMHKEVRLEKTYNKKGEEYLRGFQPEIREKEQLRQEQRSLERSLDRGGFER